jgi:hypothetical protein
MQRDLDPARGIINGAVIGLVLWILLLFGARSLFGQVTAEAHLSAEKVTELSVGPVATPQRVTIMLYRDAGAAVLGDSVRCLISPRDFILQPNTIQTIRIRVDDTVAVGEVLRVATLFIPMDSVTQQAVALRVAIRLVTKVVAAP